jgi:hypothetical protein
MEADEVEDGLALLGVEVEAGEESVSQLDALSSVLAGAPGFAGVVEEQGKEKKVEAVDFREQLSEALFVIVGGLAKTVDVMDGQEGVLVDGIAVIAVADDQCVNAVKLGDEHFKHAECVHGAEGVCGVGSEQDFA